MSVLPLARDEPWTEADLDDLDEHWKYEIVDGRLLVSPRPVSRHALVVTDLSLALARVLRPGLACVAEVMLTLPTSSRVPDLIVAQRSDLSGTHTSLPPDRVLLAIEVESPSSVGEDRIRKPAEYAAAGIPAYWQVTTDDVPQITAYLLEGSAYRIVSGPSPRSEHPFPIDLSTF